MDPIRFEEDVHVTIQALGWRNGDRCLPLQGLALQVDKSKTLSRDMRDSRISRSNNFLSN